MKFLFITTRPLIPNNAGNTVRTYSIMKWLKSKGHIVNWISFVTDSEQNFINENTQELNTICDKFTPILMDRKKAYINCFKAIFTGNPFKAEFYNFKEAKEIIKNELKNNDYDYVSGYLYMTAQFLKLSTKKEKRWLDLVDSISMLYERQIPNCQNLIKKLLLTEEKRRVLNVEKYSIKNFDLVTMISEVDKKHLSNYMDTSKIILIKNGVNIDERFSVDYNPNEIAYLGHMEYIQNHNAAMWFIENVLPKLVQINPQVLFKIIGKDPKPELYEYCKNNKNVVITGQVDDVKQELMDAAVLVCPIKISSGLQNKVLEAMSIGIPSIVSPQVAIPITTDKNILPQAHETQEWTERIDNICRDKELRAKLSSNSKEFIKENFAWDNILNELSNTLERVSRE